MHPRRAGPGPSPVRAGEPALGLPRPRSRLAPSRLRFRPRAPRAIPTRPPSCSPAPTCPGADSLCWAAGAAIQAAGAAGLARLSAAQVSAAYAEVDINRDASFSHVEVYVRLPHLVRRAHWTDELPALLWRSAPLQDASM